MTLFVDASALVAMIANEAERDTFIRAVANATEALWSPMTSWESALALHRSYEVPFEQGRAAVEKAAINLQLHLVPIGGDEMQLALDAYQQYGKGNHPTRLNMGDCFAYACAKTNNARLLYKGDDFSRTDLA